MPTPDASRAQTPSGNADLYQKAAELGKDAVDDQMSELDSMRSRSVQFLAFVGSATAFLVGTAIHGSVTRDGWFGLLGTLGTLGILALLLLLRSVLTGTRFWIGGKAMEWHFRLDPTAYTEWLDEQGKRITPEHFYRHLAETYRGQKVSNDAYLRVLRRRYFAFIVVATTVLFLWGALAWAYGRA